MKSLLKASEVHRSKRSDYSLHQLTQGPPWCAVLLTTSEGTIVLFKVVFLRCVLMGLAVFSLLFLSPTCEQDTVQKGMTMACMSCALSHRIVAQAELYSLKNHKTKMIAHLENLVLN